MNKYENKFEKIIGNNNNIIIIDDKLTTDSF